jgi:hypothetical protein
MISYRSNTCRVLWTSRSSQGCQPAPCSALLTAANREQLPVELGTLTWGSPLFGARQEAHPSFASADRGRLVSGHGCLCRRPASDIVGRHSSVALTVKPGWPCGRADMPDKGSNADSFKLPSTAEALASYVKELLADSQRIRQETQTLKRQLEELREEFRAVEKPQMPCEKAADGHRTAGGECLRLPILPCRGLNGCYWYPQQ